jgi:hypothetical protein
MLVSIVRDLGEGSLFYRFASPKELCGTPAVRSRRRTPTQKSSPYKAQNLGQNRKEEKWDTD